MKKYLVFILLLFPMFILKASAAGAIVENYDTYYNWSIPEDIIDTSLVIDQQGTTLKDFLQSIIDLESDYYNTKLDLRYTAAGALTSISLTTYPKDMESLEVSIFGRNYSSSSINSTFQNPRTKNTFDNRTFNINNLQSSLPQNIYQNASYLSFYLCYMNDTCDIAVAPSRWGNQFSRYNTNSYFNNNSSYNISRTTGYELNLLYYTSSNLILKNDFCDTNSSYTCFFKTLKINDITYNLGDRIPTYYDLYFAPANNGFNPYQIGLGTFLVGSIPKANINNFKMDISFNYEDYNYASTFNIKPSYYGRVNNNTYYSYESINCTASTLYSLSYDTTKNKANGSLFPYGFTCSSDLTNYDYIYLNFVITPGNTAYSDVVHNYTYNANYGNIYNFVNTFINQNDLQIYEKFEDVSSNTSFLLSTNEDKSTAYYVSTNKDNMFLTVDRKNNNRIGQVYYNPITFGSIQNFNVLLFSYYPTSNYKLDLFFNSNAILSYSNDSTFTYYDVDNNIESSTIINNVLVNDNSYDLSYYFDLVNNYIDSIESDLFEVHNITQNTYDIIPSPFNTAIFILFILSCIFILFTIIKR